MSDGLKNGDPCEVSYDGLKWRDGVYYIGGLKNGRHMAESVMGNRSEFNHARPIQAPKPKKMRPMTRCEMIAWACRVTMELAQNPDADVWVVGAGGIDGMSKTHCGIPAMSCTFTEHPEYYWRSRLDKETGMPIKWERTELEN